MIDRRGAIAALGLVLAGCSLLRDPERYSGGAPVPADGGSGAAGASGSDGGVTPTGCVKQVATSGRWTCALRTDGKPYCWGDNFYGQLGDGSKTDRGKPVEVQGFVGGVRQISAGEDHACAVKDDDTLWCWGDNAYGQLGIGNNTDHTTPIKVPFDGVAQVSAGANRTCVLKLDGSLWCWGINGNGWLGVPASTCPTKCSSTDTACCLSPVQVTGVGTPLGLHARFGTATWDAAGKLFAWGGIFLPSTPTEVTGITGAVVEAQCPSLFSVARTQAGAVWAWGSLPSGGAYLEQPTELMMNGVPELTDLAAGVYHICVGTTDGVWCWGENCDGQLGDGSPQSCDTGFGPWQDVPVRAANLEGEILEVAAGFAHTCAITAASELWCWGRSDSGELGGKTTRVPLPVDLPCP